MNRRQLLHAFAGVALGASPLVAAASLPRVRDEKSVAVMAIGKPGLFAVSILLENLPMQICSVAIGTSRLYLSHFRTDFDRIHCVDERCLPDPNDPIAAPAMYERLRNELRAQLPQEQRWLVVGSLSGEAGSVLIPMIAQEARQSARQAHVFAMGSRFWSESAFTLAEKVRLEVERWAADCTMMPDDSWAQPVAEDANFLDDLDDLDAKCLAWARGHLGYRADSPEA